VKAVIALAAMSLFAVTSASAGGNERNVMAAHHPHIVVPRRPYVVVPYPSAWSIHQSLRRPYLCYLPSEPCDNTQRVQN
jgi:uncharacterized membrane protein YeiH